MLGNNTGTDTPKARQPAVSAPKTNLSRSELEAKVLYLEKQKHTEKIQHTEKKRAIVTEKRQSQSYADLLKTIWFKPAILLICSLLGLLLYLGLPAAYKIFSFLIPALALSWSFAKSGINFHILLLTGLLFVLFPTSLFTLDASSSINWDLVRVQNYIESGANVISGIFFIAIPILCVIGAIYAFAVGRINDAISSIVKVVLIVIILAVFLFLANVFQIPILGNLSGIKSISDLAFGAINAIGGGAGNILNKIDFLNWFPDIPPMPEMNIMLDAVRNPNTIRLTIIGSYPVLLCLTGILIAVLSLILRQPIPTFQIDPESELSRPSAINYEFLIFLVIILITYFSLYLWLGEENFLTYRNLGFFTIYLTIISVSALALAFGLGSIAKQTWTGMIFGPLYGVVALYICFNLFTQDTTFQLLSTETPPTSVSWYIVLTQFIAVAPAESFLFHVFIPGLSLYIIFLSIRRFNNSTLDEQIAKNRRIIERLQLENQFYQIQLLKPRLSKEQAELVKSKDLGDTADYLIRIEEIQRLTNQINTFELEKRRPIQFQSKQLKLSHKITFYVVCLGSNILFSMLHFFNSGMDIRLFWSSGLGLVYTLSGIILTLISFRYGWLAGIATHALNNSWGLIMLMLIGGV